MWQGFVSSAARRGRHRRLLSGCPVVTIRRDVPFAGKILSDGDPRRRDRAGELDALNETRGALQLSAGAGALAAIGPRQAAVERAVDDRVVLDALLVMTDGVEREGPACRDDAKVEGRGGIGGDDSVEDGGGQCLLISADETELAGKPVVAVCRGAARATQHERDRHQERCETG